MLNNNNRKKIKNTNLKQYQIMANSIHMGYLDEIAKTRCTSRAQLIRDAIFSFLVREFKAEGIKQQGFNDLKRNLDRITNNDDNW